MKCKVCGSRIESCWADRCPVCEEPICSSCQEFVKPPNRYGEFRRCCKTCAAEAILLGWVPK